VQKKGNYQGDKIQIRFRVYEKLLYNNYELYWILSGSIDPIIQE